jgi:hypothetical protein
MTLQRSRSAHAATVVARSRSAVRYACSGEPHIHPMSTRVVRYAVVRPGSCRSVVRCAPLAVALLACSSDGPRPGATVRDSSGIMIVESVSPSWQSEEGWRIEAAPTVDVGIIDGSAPYQLYRAWSAVRLSDGRIVVANGGTNELRFYDSAGSHLLSVGRTGEGPGEFRDLQRVWLLPGDSLLAYDFLPSRLSVFSATGEFVRFFHVTSTEGRQVLVRGPFADGSLLVASAPIWNRPGATTGVVRDSVPYFRYDAEGSLLHGLGFYPSIEVYRTVTEESWRLTGVPFARAPVVGIATDRYYFGPADAYELHVFTLAGEFERLVRLANVERRVRDEHVAAYRAERLAMAEREGTRASMERTLAAVPYPSTLPPYERLIVDLEGNVWVADYSVPSHQVTIWRVFTTTGEYLGEVEVPSRLELLDVASDYVLGRWVDDLEVEHIRLHELVKP